MPSHLFKKSASSLFAILFLMCIPARTKAAEPPAPITLLSTTYLPEITGDFDHFAVDLSSEIISSSLPKYTTPSRCST